MKKNPPKKFKCPISNRTFKEGEIVVMKHDGSFTKTAPLSVDDIINIASRNEDGTTDCPVCGRVIGEFEPHNIMILRGFAISCDTFPKGMAQEMDGLREVI